MKKLRPTVKRDLSLSSVQAWQLGYGKYFENVFGKKYNVIFYYDGVKVNFYHTLEDFENFKSGPTERLISDNVLFKKLNNEFKENVISLRKITDSDLARNIKEVFELIGKVMSLYMFIVSDSFVQKVPEAWESRHASEGILYELDEKIENYISVLLNDLGLEKTFAHFLTIKEIENVINNKSFSVSDELRKRKKGYIIYNEKIIVDKSFNDFCVECDFVNPEADSISETSIIKGNPGYGGIVTGKVRIINKKEDVANFGDGEILVSIMTNVNYLPAIKKARGIITDEGGITCHAVIVARELKKPCIIGTKIATKVLKDGDMVEVDAENGIIKVLKKS